MFLLLLKFRLPQICQQAFNASFIFKYLVWILEVVLANTVSGFCFFPQCDLEGAASNVTISVNLPANGSPLQDILVHPCVTSLDSAILTASSVDGMDDSAFSGPYKFPFTPPSDVFDLCYYTSQVITFPSLQSLSFWMSFLRNKKNLFSRL